jgi:hypothetical protein
MLRALLAREMKMVTGASKNTERFYSTYELSSTMGKACVHACESTAIFLVSKF